MTQPPTAVPDATGPRPAPAVARDGRLPAYRPTVATVRNVQPIGPDPADPADLVETVEHRL
ncbi:hypothetical protein [Streptomyces lunalinharesii]|uniref:Uncharacterized protein n=1 Tax=Streptomyces lunalinharesii TaxID=333384 RepID=A0ABN3RB59_9ACTN